MVSRRGFLGLLGAATTTAYFFAPVGGWSSNLIINPNNLPAPAIHKANAVYGRYNWIDLNVVESRGIPVSEPLMPIDHANFSVPWIKPYKRSEVRYRPDEFASVLDVWNRSFDFCIKLFPW